MYISRLPLVDVIVGAVPPGHSNDAGHVTVLGVPSAVNSRTNELTAEATTLDIVSVVTLAFNDTMK